MKIDFKKTIRSYLIIAAGSIIFALSFNWFFVPNTVAMGGVTGLAQVVNHFLPQATVGTLVILLNVPLFLAGWKLIGLHLLASSLFSMALSSVAIDVIPAFYTFPAMDPMLACLCGGAAMGVGLGIVFSQGATTGGTDVVARLLKLRFPWLPMGKLVVFPDFAILTMAAITFGKVQAALYGFVALFVSAKVMDTVLYGLDTSKVAYIITDCWKPVTDRILTMDRGVTILHAQGAYTGVEKQVLMVAFKQREIVQIRRMVHDVDPKAFFIVCDAHEVLGEGFGEYQGEEI